MRIRVPLFVVALLLSVALHSQSGAPSSGTVAVQLLAINDFHGFLETTAGANGRIGRVPAGGVEYLATHVKQAIAQNPNSLVVAAGDVIGASPLMSALFHDEPAIEAMNALGLSVTSVGNHDFDEGVPELFRMQRGGCHPVDGCQGGQPFGGAAFTYLSANVVRADARGRRGPVFPATAVRTVGGVKIGFIGETLKGTPAMVTPEAVRGLTFLDEASTANTYAAQLKQQGVRAIVLLVHQGGEQTASGDYEPNGCVGMHGAILPIVNRLTPDIKVVISGHTHQFYNCAIAGHTVTSASSFGRMMTRVNLTIDRATDTIRTATATNEIVTQDVERDAAETRIITNYSPRVAPLANRVEGVVTGDFVRRENEAGESALGDLIADAHLASASPANKGGAVIAFTNPGGLRADIIANQQSGAEAPGEVTFAELFAAQPFGNTVTVLSLTGRSLLRLLEQQFDNPTRGATKMLQVSRGFTYRYDLSAPAGHRVDPSSIKVNGAPVAPTDIVRIAANNFLTAGGDGFTVFREGTPPTVGDLDIDALVAYFRAHSPVAPEPLDRIIRME